MDSICNDGNINLHMDNMNQVVSVIPVSPSKFQYQPVNIFIFKPSDLPQCAIIEGSESCYRSFYHWYPKNLERNMFTTVIHLQTQKLTKFGSYENAWEPLECLRIGWSILSPFTYRDCSVYGLSQWDTTLQCNIASHWLNPYTEWCLYF